MLRRALRLLLWRSLALGCVVLGLIGVVLPGLPTVPFLLVAAWAGGKGWPALEAWLLNHPRFGPMVRDWRQHRAVPLRAKHLALVMMVIGSLTAAFTLPRLQWLPALCCTAVGWWLWHLPTREALPTQSTEASSSGNSGKV